MDLNLILALLGIFVILLLSGLIGIVIMGVMFLFKLLLFVVRAVVFVVALPFRRE